MGRRWSRLSLMLTCTAGLVVFYWMVQLRLASVAVSWRLGVGGGRSFSNNGCVPSCGSIMHRLMLYLTGRVDAPSPGMLRREDCVNDTETLLKLLRIGDNRESEKQLKISEGPNYVRLAEPVSPVGVSLACQNALFSNADDASLTEKEFGTGLTGCFNQSYSEAELTKIYHLLNRLNQNFSQRGLEIFLTDGSLIGSGRHFGVIPWDDDVDFMVREDQKYEVRKLLTELSELDEFQFVDTEQTNQHWRLEILCQRLDSSNPNSKRCRFSVDLFFGKVLGQYFSRPEWQFSFDLADVYPLSQRPFGPYLFAAPNKPDEFLAKGYSDNYYSSCLFEIHSDKFRCEQKVTTCASLRRFYPFVSRLRLRLRDRRLFDADILTWQSRLHAIYIPRQ